MGSNEMKSVDERSMGSEGSVTSRSLFRLGGLSALIGGGLLVFDVFLHLFVDDTLTPAEQQRSAPEAHIPVLEDSTPHTTPMTTAVMVVGKK